MEKLDILNGFEKYDWPVNIDRTIEKNGDEYDVIIVGSGIAGLACATLLSKKGFRVLLLEHHDRAGGFAGSFLRKGFMFNNGLEEISGIWESGPITCLAKEAGLDTADYFVLHKAAGIQYKTSEDDLTVPDNLEDLVSMLAEMFPDEGENLVAFMEDAEKAQDEYYRYADTYNVAMTPELVAKALGIAEEQYRQENPHIYDWLSCSVEKKFNEYFKNSELIDMLTMLMIYHGTDLDVTPAHTLLRSYGYFRNGNYYSKGGAQRFVNALRKFIKRQGVEVLFNHKVDEIVVRDNRVAGVRAAGKTFNSPVVVSSAHACNTYLQLVDGAHLEEQFIRYIQELEIPYSLLMVFLGVDMDLSDYPAIIHNHTQDGGYMTLIASNTDPKSAPAGKANVVLFQLCAYDDFPQRSSQTYLEKKKAASDALIAKAEKQIPGLRDHIVVEDAATPQTLERYNFTPGGTGEGLEDTINNVKPCFKSPIQGLYQVGNSVFPGSGMELAATSGMICANDICNWGV